MTYAYDAKGRLAKQTIGDNFVEFSYNAKGLLVQVNDINGNPLEEYASDPGRQHAEDDDQHW